MKETITVALGQFHTGPDREENRSKGETMVREAAAVQADVLAFPEMAFEPFFPQHPTDPKFFQWAEPVPGPTSNRFADLAREHGILVLINILQKMQRGQYFDATVACHPEEGVAGYSHMMHICETPGFHEKYYYWPGITDFPVFKAGRATVAPCICYDRHYPEVMRILTLRGAEMIIVQTATTKEEAGSILEAEMQAAALANGVYVALVNKGGRDGGLDFAGRSFIVEPNGSIMTQSSSDGDDLIVAELDLGKIDRARHQWPLLRDRRPELYGELMTDMNDVDWS